MKEFLLNLKASEKLELEDLMLASTTPTMFLNELFKFCNNGGNIEIQSYFSNEPIRTDKLRFFVDFQLRLEETDYDKFLHRIIEGILSGDYKDYLYKEVYYGIHG